jgi:hypothetical protein
VRIVEGAFFQIPVGLMLAQNAPPARIRALLLGIEARIAVRQPALVYLHRPDLRRAFDVIGRERGTAWLDEVIGVLARSPYGRRHRVRDVRGLIGYYRRQRAIVDAVLPALSLRRLAIDVSGRRWPQYARRMSAFLDIRQAAPDELGPAGLLRHVGPYRGRASGATSIVTTDARALYLQQPASSAEPLVRVGPGRYCVRSLPIELRFSYDASGAARRFLYDSRMVNETVSDRSWMRV